MQDKQCLSAPRPKQSKTDIRRTARASETLVWQKVPTPRHQIEYWREVSALMIKHCGSRTGATVAGATSAPSPPRMSNVQLTFNDTLGLLPRQQQQQEQHEITQRDRRYIGEPWGPSTWTATRASAQQQEQQCWNFNGKKSLCPQRAHRRRPRYHRQSLEPALRAPPRPPYLPPRQLRIEL